MAKPLDKKDKSGKPYSRPADIETAIDAALGQDLETVCGRARLNDPQATGYMPTECLLHLIRDARRRKDKTKRDRLILVLLTRLDRMLKGQIPSSWSGDVPGTRQKVLDKFTMLLAEDGAAEDQGVLDFYECRFNRAFRALRLTTLQEEAPSDVLVSTPERAAQDEDTIPDDERWEKVSELARTPPNQEDRALLGAVLKELKSLPEDQTKAVVLRRIMGLTDKAAAKACGVDERTIRNRLKRADENLKKFKEE